MQKPLLVVAILGLAWTAMDLAAVAYAGSLVAPVTSTVVCISCLGILIFLIWKFIQSMRGT